MSTEARRIKKIIRGLPEPEIPLGTLLTEANNLLGRSSRRIPAKKAYQQHKVSEGHVYALTKPRAVEGYVTLTQLASERGIQAQLARIWVKNAGWSKPTYGWRWKEGSRSLQRIRKVLGLPS